MIDILEPLREAAEIDPPAGTEIVLGEPAAHGGDPDLVVGSIGEGRDEPPIEPIGPVRAELGAAGIPAAPSSARTGPIGSMGGSSRPSPMLPTTRSGSPPWAAGSPSTISVPAGGSISAASRNGSRISIMAA